MSAISFQQVTKRYPNGTLAVSDLNLEIARGQTTMLVGPSGCGKTTTLRMINRMIEPTSGTILIDGVDTATRPKAALRRSIGYVIQNAGLFPHRTVLQNIMTVPRLSGVGAREAAGRARELMELVGLPAELAPRYPAQLSGGQQQRVGVARALAGQPDLILMDEPFSALDPVVRGELQAEFARLKREVGMTVVFVTHDIDEAIKLGDQVAIFAEGGHLAQYAPPAQLLRFPASAHVAEFIGRDRGFRALSFTPLNLPGDFKLDPLPEVTHTVDPAATSPTLVTDQSGVFTGWVAPGQGQVSSLAGSFPPDATLREALDAVLASPLGKAVALDEAGRPRGLLTLAHLAQLGLVP
ncbi:ATP-binding cassette domain-containing protein [Actinomyces sp. F1_1611]